MLCHLRRPESAMGCTCGKMNYAYGQDQKKMANRKAKGIRIASAPKLEAGDSQTVTSVENIYAKNRVSKFDVENGLFREGDRARPFREKEIFIRNTIRRNGVNMKIGQLTKDLVLEDIEETDEVETDQEDESSTIDREGRSLLGELPPLVQQPLAGLGIGRKCSALELVEQEEAANRPLTLTGSFHTLRGSYGALRRTHQLAQRKKVMEQRAIEESKQRLRARRVMYSNAMAAAKQKDTHFSGYTW